MTIKPMLIMLLLLDIIEMKSKQYVNKKTTWSQCSECSLQTNSCR